MTQKMLFGKNKKEKELKGKISDLMNQYDKEQIDGETYMRKMLDLSDSYGPKKNVL